MTKKQMYTVKELAKLAGVSVRTLHHYDDIGLLKPARVGENRYRYYGRNDLLRLQQILIHRELDIPLSEIAAILDAPNFDRVGTLRRQRKRLAQEAKRYAGIVRTIDRTIAQLEGDRAMNDKELYSGVVSPEKQATYERWLEERFGDGIKESITASKKAVSKWTKAEMDAAMAELKEAEQGLADAMSRGVAAKDAANAPLLTAHRNWVAKMWGKPCPPEAYAGLADLYLSHPDFEKRYETIAPGFTAYLTDAMKAWAAGLNH